MEISGAPPDGAAPEAVAAALQSPPGERETRFTLVPEGAGGMRYLLEFGASSGGGCAAPRGAAGGQALTLSATLCRGDDALSSATLRSAEIAGPSDPEFAGAASALLRAVLTPDEPRTRFGGDD